MTKQTEKKFVLIDDDPVFCNIMLRIAKNQNIKLDVYSSLLEMGHVGLLGQYDVALVDYDLGQMNGIEIAEYLSALFGNIPMVLVSGSERSRENCGPWPDSIKAFAHKNEGYENVIRKALIFNGEDTRPRQLS